MDMMSVPAVAPHVKHTGGGTWNQACGDPEYKGGVRISMLCVGSRALEDYHQKEKNNREIAVMLSAKEYETAAEVTRLKEELNSKKAKIAEFGEEMKQKVEKCLEGCLPGIISLFEETDPVMTRTGQPSGKKVQKWQSLFPGDKEGYRYVLGSRKWMSAAGRPQ